MRMNKRTVTLELIDQTIEQYRKIIAIKSYVSYESDLIDRIHLDRLYKLKEKIEQRKGNR